MTPNSALLTTCWTALLILIAPAAGAQESATAYDRISLSASATREVDNDILVAVLYAQREGPDASRLAAEVNGTVAWGVTQAKRVAGIKVQTLDYRTAPVYNKQSLSGWRVSQSMRLEAREAALLSELVGVLQDRLALRSIGYAVSEERRRDAEDALIAQAIKAFQDRARLITREFGRTDFRVVQADVNAGGNRPGPMPMRAMAMERASAPTLEAGTESVRVRITGTIELQPR